MVILLQSDHGFKFSYDDPDFDSEACKILYAVYCSDGIYPGWNNSVNSVNSFRILFNKYFNTGFDLLPGRSYNLFYK